MPTLTPPATVEHVESCAPASSERVSCPTCGKTFSGGAVVNGHYARHSGRSRGRGPTAGERLIPEAGPEFCREEYEWSEEHQCSVMLRRFYCDHCNHLVQWLEEIDQDFHDLTGQIVSGPGVTRAKATINRFLTDFPEAAGVQQKC
jgi:hypothetical protein